MTINPVSYSPPDLIQPADAKSVDAPIPGVKTSVDTYIASPSTITSLDPQITKALENQLHPQTTGIVDTHSNTVFYTTNVASAQASEAQANAPVEIKAPAEVRAPAEPSAPGSIVNTFA